MVCVRCEGGSIFKQAETVVGPPKRGLIFDVHKVCVYGDKISVEITDNRGMD